MSFPLCGIRYVDPDQSFWEVLSPQQQRAYMRLVNNNRTALFQIMISDQLGSSDIYFSESSNTAVRGSSAVTAESIIPVGLQSGDAMTGTTSDRLQATEGHKLPSKGQQSADTPADTSRSFSTVQLWMENMDPVEIQLNGRPYKDDPVWLVQRG